MDDYSEFGGHKEDPVELPSESDHHTDKKRQYSDVDSLDDPVQTQQASKRHFPKAPDRSQSKKETTFSDASFSDIETPSKIPPPSSTRKNTLHQGMTPRKKDDTVVVRTPLTVERFGIPASVAKKIQKHVPSSYPNPMDVISSLQQTAIERNSVPTPEENSLALMDYYQSIVYSHFLRTVIILA